MARPITPKCCSSKFNRNTAETNLLSGTIESSGRRSKLLEKRFEVKPNRNILIKKSRDEIGKCKKRSLSINCHSSHLIMEQFLCITNKNIWKSVLSNFKKNPSKLINLISQSRVKSRKIKIRNTLFNNDESDKEDDVVTFKNSQQVTQDWSKSLLYWKVRNGVHKDNQSSQDIQKKVFFAPGNQKDLEKGIEEGLMTIEKYLLEMLGTREELEDMKNRAENVTVETYQQIYGRCFKVFKVRCKAVKILKLICIRESLMERLANKGREVIDMICVVNNSLRPALFDWRKDKSVSFKMFVFKGVDYLEKIDRDNLIVQKYLN